MVTGDMLLGLGSLGVIAGMLFVFLAVMIVFYIYFAFALMTIAKKTKTKDAWLAWIPIANFYLMLKIGKQPTWHMLSLLLAFIPYIGTVALMVLSAYWWWKIAEVRGKQGWLGILMIVPFVNLVVLGYLAWSE